jgi:hypothetical protein
MRVKKKSLSDGSINERALLENFQVYDNINDGNLATNAGGEQINLNVGYQGLPKMRENWLKQVADDAPKYGKARTPYFVTDDMPGTIVHEFGHSVYRAAEGTVSTELYEFKTAWYAMKGSDNWISEYATTNVSEGFAEAFAAYVTDKRPLPADMQQSIEGIFKRLRSSAK